MLKKYFLEKAYIPLLTTIVILTILAIIKKGYSADLQIGDAYYVLTINFLVGCFAVLLLLQSFLYWLIIDRKKLRQLTAIHVLGTIGLMIYIVSIVGSNTQTPDSITLWDYKKMQDQSSLFLFCMVTLLALQTLLFINIGYAFWKGKR